MNRFTRYSVTNATDILTMRLLRSATAALADLFNEHVPEGREKSLALTNLEQALMWANASIARTKGDPE